VPPARIALLLHSNYRSGGNLAMLRHALYLAGLGHAVEVVFQEDWHGTDLGFLPGHTALPTRLLADWPAGEVVDIAITNWWVSAYAFPALPARQYAFFRHGEEKPLFANRVLDAAIDMLLRERFVWFAVSPPLMEALRAEGQAPVLVPNGVEVARFAAAAPALPPCHGTLRVLVEGSAGAPHKRVNATIEMLRSVPGVEIVHMAADGSRPALPVDHALGAVPHGEVAGVYAACDLLVKLSTQEAFPLPVLEQFAAGGTAIVARFAGSEQFIEDGVNALLVEQDHAERAARAALLGLMAEPVRLAGLRRAAQATARRFDWEAACRSFADELLAACPRRAGPPQPLPVVEAYRACALDGLALWAEREARRG
jgi:glycosyltransferase involved in cell wall biosynthesis